MPDVDYKLAGKRVWVAGHRGMVRSARRFAIENCEPLSPALIANMHSANFDKSGDVVV